MRNVRFLWAFLTIEDICSRKSDKDIRRSLQGLPLDLHATFDRALDRIVRNKSNTTIVQKAFTLIKAALEPLTLTQLREALSVEIGQQTLNDDDLISGIDRLPTWCENLVCVEEADTVHFSHHSIQKYLLNPGSGDLKDFHIQADKCDRFMGELCVTYISLDNFQRAVGFTKSSNADASHMKIDMGGLAEQTMQTAVGGSLGSLIGRFTREVVMASQSMKASPGKISWNDAMVSSRPQPNFGPAQDTKRYTFLEYASERWFHHQLCIDSKDNEATWRLLGQILRRPRQYSQGEPWYNPPWRKGVCEIIDNDVILFGPGFESYRETVVSLETDENAKVMHTSTLQDLCLAFIYAIQTRNGGLACRVFMLLVEDYKSPANRRLHGFLRIIINRMAVNKNHEICENRCLSRARLQLSHVDLVRELRAAVASGILHFPPQKENETQQICTCPEVPDYSLRDEMCQLLTTGYRRKEQPYLFPFAVLAEELGTGSSVERLRALSYDKRFDFEVMLSSKTRLGRSVFDILIEGALIDRQRMHDFLSEKLDAQESLNSQPNSLFDFLGKSTEIERVHLQHQFDNTLIFLGMVQATAADTTGIEATKRSLAQCLGTGGSVPLHKATIELLFEKILLQSSWPTSVCEGIVKVFFGKSLMSDLEDAHDRIFIRAVKLNNWGLATSLIDIQPVFAEEREGIGDFAYIKHALRCADCRKITSKTVKSRKKWSFDLTNNKYKLCSRHLKSIGKKTDGKMLLTEAKALWSKSG
ncbi:hypothetical protein IL306_005365 [Fusarium sp. DS 682]|nr:hypothetical protein IL306_005365 [Fusarium sp. DS 682]